MSSCKILSICGGVNDDRVCEIASGVDRFGGGGVPTGNDEASESVDCKSEAVYI